MNWGTKILDKIKTVFSFKKKIEQPLNITEGSSLNETIVKNMVWYRGDPDELMQLYKHYNNVDGNFWGAVPLIKIHKIHTGLPSIIVDTLTKIVLRDMNDIVIEDAVKSEEWNVIEKDNKFKDILKDAIKDVYAIGDGAFKISFDSEISQYPIIEFFNASNVRFKYKRGRLVETIFKTEHTYNHRSYVHEEHYGHGYIKNKLIDLLTGNEVSLSTISKLSKYQDYGFAGYDEEENKKGTLNLAIPFIIYKSEKYKGRGRSIYEKKLATFDALDEIVSQWMDAIRAGRTNKYIPESLLPRDPNTGKPRPPNDFDNRFIATESSGNEGSKDVITTEQPSIPSENYMNSYINFLDTALQGIVSPSTLGIDVKKLDNAEAQREKEKATLYTLNDTVVILQALIPLIVETTLKAYDIFQGNNISYDIDISVDWGEYANPSFEATVETVGKAKTQGIMSLEASVEELYGDSKDDDWKIEEVARLKSEQGIVEMEEPKVNEIKVDDTLPSNLNGAQIASLLKVVEQNKNGLISRESAISIITSTLGIPRDTAETFIEMQLKEGMTL